MKSKGWLLEISKRLQSKSFSSPKIVFFMSIKRLAFSSFYILTIFCVLLSIILDPKIQLIDHRQSCDALVVPWLVKCYPYVKPYIKQ